MVENNLDRPDGSRQGDIREIAREGDMPENTFHNKGDFRGAAVFQGSTIHNAGQIAGTLSKADSDSRKELQSLLQQLGDALRSVPTEKVQDAEAVSGSAEDLVREASKETPDASRLRSLGQTLVGLAKTVDAAAPAAVSLAGSIVDLVGKINSLG
jgi:hypothetical protein